MQLLKIGEDVTDGCSQVHKPMDQHKNFMIKAYELVNNLRSVIHKFISQRARSTKSFQAYELTNNFALKKKRIIYLLLNRLRTYYLPMLKNESEYLKVTFLYCANG